MAPSSTSTCRTRSGAAPPSSVAPPSRSRNVAVPPLAPGESHRHSLSLAPLRRGAFGVRARCVVGGRAVAEAEAPLMCDTLE